MRMNMISKTDAFHEQLWVVRPPWLIWARHVQAGVAECQYANSRLSVNGLANCQGILFGVKSLRHLMLISVLQHKIHTYIRGKQWSWQQKQTNPLIHRFTT